MSVVMEYGGEVLSPTPFMSINKTFQKTAAGIDIGTIFIITLRGTLIDLENGIAGIIDDKQRYIREVFDRSGKYFSITCNGVTLFECYPLIIQDIVFEPSPDNWVYTCPFSVVLQCNNEPTDVNSNQIPVSGENIGGSASLAPPFISSAEDSWQFEFDQNTSKYSLGTSAGTDTNSIVLRATHDVSAIGKLQYEGPLLSGRLRQPAYLEAKDYVTSKLVTNPLNSMVSGILNVATGGFGVYDYYRVQRHSEAGGSFSVSESYVLTSGSPVIEEFNVDIRGGASDAFTTTSINGSIQGLESRTYGSGPGGFSISTTKFAAASGYFESIKDTSLIYPRMQALVASEGITLNTDPLVKIVGKAPSRGVITYQYEYNNRPSNCIAGAKQENISINDENPTDVFSRIVVMGRAQGPILQSFNTKTEFRRSISIDALMSPPTGCTLAVLTGTNNPSSSVRDLLCIFEADLRARYNKVYKERDSTLWEPKQGRYSRSVTYAAVDCTSVPAISLCSGA